MNVWDSLAKLDAPGARRVLDLERQIRAHPVWSRLSELEQVHRFMERHVWAVWDFMCLLKSVQAELAPARVPWLPPSDAMSARLINEIVACEEGDELEDGTFISHFELYLLAMDDAGADARPIRQFVGALSDDVDADLALDRADIPDAVKAFVRHTLSVCRAPLPERVAALTLGREALIPSMWAEAVRDLRGDPRLSLFEWYLRRHIEVDGDRHGPLARRLFELTCLSTDAVCARSIEAAIRTLEHRVALWNDVAGVQV